MTLTQELFQQKFPQAPFLFAYDLAAESYFKIGGPAEVYYQARELAESKKVLHFAHQQKIPVTILGGASNVLIADQGISGLVVKVLFNDWRVLADDKQLLRFQAGAGLKTNQVVAKAAALGGSGLEGFIGVPGSLGGAIYNNAHYLEDLIGNFVEEVAVYDFARDKEFIFSREKCQFAYEHSIFQEQKNLLIVAVTFQLNKAELAVIQAKMRAAQEKRQKTQPLDLPSSGCFFQNPANNQLLRELFPQFAERAFVPAGFLIEQSGLKGKREGDAQISDKHAAFIVNLGQAREKDVKKLVALAKQEVKERFAVELKEEVFYLGDSQSKNLTKLG